MTPLERRLTRRTVLGGAATAAGLAALPAHRGAAAPTVRRPYFNKLQKVKLRVAQLGSLEGAKLAQEILGGFTAEQPDIEVEVFPIEAPDWDVFFQKLLTQIAAGQVPDMVLVATEGTQLFAGKGLAAPLDDFVQRDKEQLREYFSDVTPSLVEAMFYEGHLYELPDSYNAANIIYNTTMFQDRGVPLPTDAWTIDDFTNAMPKLLKQEDGQTTEYGFYWVNRMWGGAMPWIFVNDSNILTEERAPNGEWFWNEFYKDDPTAQGRGGGWQWKNSRANDPKNVEALQYLVDLTHEIKAAPDPVTSEAQLQVVEVFGNRQLASFIGGGFRVASVRNAGIGPDEYDAAFMPKWKTQRHQFGSVGYVVMQDSPNKEAAWELLKYRTRKEIIANAVKGGLTTPARRSVANESLYTSETGPKSWHVFYDSVDKLDSAPIPCPPQANQVTTIFTKYIGLAMTTEMTPQAALDQMHDELAELMAQPI